MKFDSSFSARLFAGILTAVLASSANHSLMAQTTRPWTGAATTDFLTAGNWTGGVPNTTTQIALFQGNASVVARQPTLTTTAATPLRNIYGLSFTSAAGGWTLSDGGNGDGGHAGFNLVDVYGIRTIGQSSGINTINVDIRLNTSSSIMVGTGGTLVLNGNLIHSIAANLMTIGQADGGRGTLIFNGSNNRSASTNLVAGTVLFGTDDGFGRLSSGYGPNGSVATVVAAVDGGVGATIGSTNEQARDINNFIALGGGVSLTVGGEGTGSGAVTLSRVISGAGSLVVNGRTILTPGGNASGGNPPAPAGNTYTGGTIVNVGGTLLVNNTVNSGLGTGNVTVNGGRLGGTGSFTGAVIVNAGGTLAPGASIQSLGSGTATLNNGSTFAYEVDSDATLSVGADLLKTAGNLNLNGTVTLTLSDLAASPEAFALNTTFSLINYTGIWNGGLFTVDGNAITDGGTFTMGLNTWQLDYDAVTGGSNFSSEYFGSGSFVNITAVPEPGSVALLLSGVGVVVFLRRFRRRA